MTVFVIPWWQTGGTTTQELMSFCVSEGYFGIILLRLYAVTAWLKA